MAKSGESSFYAWLRSVFLSQTNHLFHRLYRLFGAGWRNEQIGGPVVACPLSGYVTFSITVWVSSQVDCFYEGVSWSTIYGLR